MDLRASWIQALSDFIGLQPWALAVFLIILLALLIDFILRRVIKRLGAVVDGTENLWDDALFEAAVRPVSLLIWLMGITLAVRVIPAREDDGLLAAGVVTLILQLGVLFSISWFLFSLVRNIEDNVIEKARREGREIDRTTVNALGRLVRIAIVITAVLIALDMLGFSISGLLAAGGIGGIALSLAAKDMLANFFGGATVYMDRPFSVGDWIFLKDQGIEGTVENIGWRQTTIRKFDKRPVYVPNAIFTTASVENPSRMTHRRLYETIGLRHDDIKQMDAITDAVRDMLNTHPEIDQKQTLMVNFDQFNQSSVDFFIYCMTRTVNWQKFHTVKQDVLLRISEIVRHHGAEMAFPTRTLKLSPTPEFAGLDIGKVHEKEQEP
jgi:MscS family membrane protein